MKLVVIHYHLNRGGVTQVVINHLHALATLPRGERPTEVLVLHDGQQDGWPTDLWGTTPPPFDVTLATLPGIRYDSTTSLSNPESLARAIGKTLQAAGFDPSTTPLHVHNHALGKNASLPGALQQLATHGFRLLLQVHDFAEDFRPANYRHLMRATKSENAQQLAAKQFPAGPAIHYAVLNGRDQALLTTAGVNQKQLHALPNPALPFHGIPSREEARGRVLSQLQLAADARLVVYPVRGIRRKNLGEMLLHAALAGDDSCYAATLAPTSPAEVAPFLHWCDLAEELDLGCRFDIGASHGVDFLDAVAAADALITTSVAEGFGMVLSLIHI